MNNIKRILILLIFIPSLSYSISYNRIGGYYPFTGAVDYLNNGILHLTSEEWIADDAKKITSNQTVDSVYHQQVYLAYKKFKERKFDEVKSLLTQYGFEKQVEKLIKVEPNVTIDSLIFLKVDGSKITLSMVDLGYLKNVSATMILHTEKSAHDLKQYERILVNDGLTLNTEFYFPSICVQFQNKDAFWVVNKRWEQWTLTKFRTMYNYTLSVYGNENLVIKFEDTVPEEWIDHENLPVDKSGKFVTIPYEPTSIKSIDDHN